MTRTKKGPVNLTVQLNIAITPSLKDRIDRLAARVETRPRASELARVMLLEGVERRERELEAVK